MVGAPPRVARKAAHAPSARSHNEITEPCGEPDAVPARWGAAMHLASRKWAPMGDRNTEFRLLARNFRARAEELLVRAETMHDTDVCLKLREIALSYHRLATRLEQRAQGRKPIYAAR